MKDISTNTVSYIKKTKKYIRKKDQKISSRKFRLQETDIKKYFHYIEKRVNENTFKIYQQAVGNLYQSLPEGKIINRKALLDWSDQLLEEGYAPRTINLRISAVNGFLKYMKYRDLQLYPMATEKIETPDLTRREYLRLLEAAKRLSKERIYYVIKTICSTGIGAQQLEQVTYEAVVKGSVMIRTQNKIKWVRIPLALQRELICYADSHNIHSGALFITRNGLPLNRSNIHNSIQGLCHDARVPEEKGNSRCLQKLCQKTYQDIQKVYDFKVQKDYEELLQKENDYLNRS